jgi:hypothetical protein
VRYPASSPDLPSLVVEEMDFSEEFKDLSTATFFIVWFLHYYLGWSPHNHIVEKLAGNWNALDVAGDALINVGQRGRTGVRLIGRRTDHARRSLERWRRAGVRRPPDPAGRRAR